MRRSAVGACFREHPGALPHGVPDGVVQRPWLDAGQHRQQERGAGAFAPIGGIYKTDVYALSRWRNESAGERGEVPPIPDHVLVKPPSAELAPDQQDERSLGVDYAELDDILEAHFEHGMDAEAVAARGHERALVDDVLRRARAYAFKRALEPPFPRTAFYE